MRSTTKRYALWQAVLGVSLVVALAGCAESSTAGTPSSSSAAQQRPSNPTTTTGSPIPPTTKAADQSSGVSAGKTYAVQKVTVSNGVGKTDIAESLEISGGDPRVAEVFNRGVRAFVQEQLDHIKSSDDPRPHSLTTHGRIYFTEGTVAEVVYGIVSYTGEAHPAKILGTITTDARTATPILIGAVFTDKQSGIAELAKATTEAMEIVHPGLAANISENLTPKESNFVNWVPTPSGLQVHIDTGRYVTGYPCVQVPWSRLRPVLGPTLKAVAEQAPDGPPVSCTAA